MSDLEFISLLRCQKILKKHHLVIIKPRSLDISELLQGVGGHFELQEFDDHFFDGVAGYNELMLSAEFYERFMDTDYILIYQLDAYVFRDELDAWCLKGYDYIGAPWIRKSKYHRWYYRIFWGTKKVVCHLLGIRSYHDSFDKVGNGGFSLRKVSTHYRVAVEMRKKIEEYLRKNKNKRFNEDVFWGLEVPLKYPDFRIPSWREALKFSFDVQVRECFFYNKNQLPFGIHGWNLRLEDYKNNIEEL
ncbi:MAG: hypothetical protein K2L23_03560 [Odoribacter sp.]|nr:hypothetical protein [Odoribacter sp.]